MESNEIDKIVYKIIDKAEECDKGFARQSLHPILTGGIMGAIKEEITPLFEEIIILREQLRGTREELARVRKGGIEEEEKKPTPEERFRELLKGCTVELRDEQPESTFLVKGGKLFFEFRKDILWCSRANVWDVFESEFNMSYNDIQNLIKIPMEEHFKCKEITHE